MNNFAENSQKLYELTVSYGNTTKFYLIKWPVFNPNYFEAVCVGTTKGFHKEDISPIYKWCEDYQLMIGGHGLIEVKEFKGDVSD